MKETFFQAVQSLLEASKDDFSVQTYRTYHFVLTKFDSFCPEIDCNSVTEEIILQFKEYMRNLGNCDNTVKKTLACLKILVNKLLATGLMGINPFLRIHIGNIQSNRKYLTLEELRRLYNTFINAHKKLSRPEFDSMQAFLFSCYTGLRYSDLKSLLIDEIQDGAIRKRMHKTGDSVYIPLVSQVEKLLSLVSRNNDGKVLHVTENTYFNRHLRIAATKLGFTKHIHCHLGRHTFATTCLTIGIPLEIVSKLLGHRSIQTTMIYAKYVDKVLDSEMLKFKSIE
jgi:site-specific recombinase XerD